MSALVLRNSQAAILGYLAKKALIDIVVENEAVSMTSRISIYVEQQGHFVLLGRWAKNRSSGGSAGGLSRSIKGSSGRLGRAKMVLRGCESSLLMRVPGLTSSASAMDSTRGPRAT